MREPKLKDIFLGFAFSILCLVGYSACQFTELEDRVKRIEDNNPYARSMMIDRDTVIIGDDTMVREVIIRKPHK